MPMHHTLRCRMIHFRYQTLNIGDLPIHVRTLLDNQQFCDAKGAAAALGISSANWPLFGTIWPSGQILANLMLSQKIEGKRILEVGCGIALSSLVLNARRADITATDYHPEVEGFLIENTRINQGRAIPFMRTGWRDAISTLGLFDLIIGSDLLYEQEHAIQLAAFINQHAQPICEIVMIDPGRGNHARFSKIMTALGFCHRQHSPEGCGYLSAPFKGKVLRYSRG